MVKYDTTYRLGAGQGDSRKASSQYIIIHDTGNDNNQGTNSAANEASYMQGHWQAAYTHAIAGHDRVYLVGEPGYVAYGAGSPANERSPYQIELAHYSDPALARAAYANYVASIWEYAVKYGIPLVLDGGGNGIKSHKWVSDNLWGDHQDPYAYLTHIGISRQQLQADLLNGVGSASTVADTGVLHVKFAGPGNVGLLNAKGQYIGKYVYPGTAWRAYQAAVINSEPAVSLGGDQYIPLKYTDWQPGKVAAVVYNGKGDVTLLDANGKYLAKTVTSGSRWQVFGAKVISNKIMYDLGGGQFLPKQYTAFQ